MEDLKIEIMEALEQTPLTAAEIGEDFDISEANAMVILSELIVALKVRREGKRYHSIEMADYSERVLDRLP
jgi:DNA-binding IclR family transcriptional regulator